MQTVMLGQQPWHGMPHVTREYLTGKLLTNKTRLLDRAFSNHSLMGQTIGSHTPAYSSGSTRKTPRLALVAGSIQMLLDLYQCGDAARYAQGHQCAYYAYGPSP
jgi:hypothetical protein